MADKVFTMRIDEDLLEKIRICAERNKRSLAKEVEFQLEQNLDNYFSPSEFKSFMENLSEKLSDHDYELRRLYEQIGNVVEHLKD